ncbi:glycosyltransferase family 2 protein [bacterium]|nr:glycosyltransferase family 2 protein [bacterium]
MIYILLPSYNEENGLQEVLPILKEISASSRDPFRVVVVDDGSKDRTSEVARSFISELDLKLITFPQNQGVTEVFKKGFKFIIEDSKEPEKDICVVLDSDNTQDPRLIPEMIRRIESGDDIVIASRFEGNGGMIGCPWTRQIFSYGVSWIMRILVGLPNVKDYSIFYRACRVGLIKSSFDRYGDRLIEGRGFASICSLLLKMGNLTRKTAEIPLILRYDNKQGMSGNKIFRTIRGYLELIWQYVISDRYRKMERLP